MTVYRINWTPGTDTLVGYCFCGAVHSCDEPIDLWAWLLAHPDGHEAAIANSSR